jgi:hypothetical protein
MTWPFLISAPVTWVEVTAPRYYWGAAEVTWSSPAARGLRDRPRGVQKPIGAGCRMILADNRRLEDTADVCPARTPFSTECVALPRARVADPPLPQATGPVHQRGRLELSPLREGPRLLPARPPLPNALRPLRLVFCHARRMPLASPTRKNAARAGGYVIAAMGGRMSPTGSRLRIARQTLNGWMVPWSPAMSAKMVPTGTAGDSAAPSRSAGDVVAAIGREPPSRCLELNGPC